MHFIYSAPSIFLSITGVVPMSVTIGKLPNHRPVVGKDSLKAKNEWINKNGWIFIYARDFSTFKPEGWIILNSFLRIKSKKKCPTVNSQCSFFSVGGSPDPPLKILPISEVSRLQSLALSHVSFTAHGFCMSAFHTSWNLFVTRCWTWPRHWRTGRAPSSWFRCPGW